MIILRVLGTVFLFFIIKQFLKLIINIGQKQMPNQTSTNSTTKKNSDNIIDATFTRKE